MQDEFDEGEYTEATDAVYKAVSGLCSQSRYVLHPHKEILSVVIRCCSTSAGFGLSTACPRLQSLLAKLTLPLPARSGWAFPWGLRVQLAEVLLSVSQRSHYASVHPAGLANKRTAFCSCGLPTQHPCH